MTETRVRPRRSYQGLITLCLCCLLVAVIYSRRHDPLAFVVMGERFAAGNPQGNVGYDGQFAYYIALDPAHAPAHIDDPPYRYQRILYPMLARLIALGQPALVPWALVLINIVSLSLGAELLGRLLAWHGYSPYLALVLPLWLGQIFALRADLNEPLCFLFVVAALWGFERERYLLSALALAAGALTKEPALLFLPAAVMALLVRKCWWQTARYAAIVLLPYAALQAWLYWWLGKPGMLASGARTEFIPFYGITFSEPPVTRAFLVIIFAVPVTVLLILAVRQLVRTPASLYAWAVLANCLFIVFLTRASTTDMLAVFRLATGVVVSALLFSAAHDLRRLAWAVPAIWLPPSMLAFMIPGLLL
jgi:hypothetical protein